MEVEKVLERAFAALEVGKLPDPEGAVAASTAMEVEILEGAVAARSPAEGDKILEGAVASRTAMEVDKVPEVRPRFVWGRRPRPNGGRRRPRGRYGFYKHAPVVSRGSYPISDKLPLGAGPQLDQFPLIAINTSPLTGNAIIDDKLERISIVYGGIARIRLLICARADKMMTSGVHLAGTKEYWKKHDKLLMVAMALREELLADHGVEAPPIPYRFYQKF